MPKPRKSQVSLEATPYYHCISRCVRRAFLCEKDAFSGRSFEHRRGWIEDRLLALGQIFAVDVAAYAVMSNPIHLVLRLNKLAANQWSSLEVIERWHRLFASTSALCFGCTQIAKVHKKFFGLKRLRMVT
jgi:hypothetical protein